ncbi:MAG: efflux RND transporter periplasmic adaptor subunit [Chloroflexota bacterium]
MIHKLRPFIVLLVIAGLIGGGYWYFNQHPQQLTQLQLKFGMITQAEAGGVQSVSGYIETEEVNVAAETGGRIARLVVDEGDTVQAGQVLVELDTDLLDARIRQAEAGIATTQAQLARTEAGIRVEEIAKAEAAVAVAEANVAAASTRWQDAITLRDNPQELDMQIDAARTALELAKLQIARAIPIKDAGEALWALGQQNWEWTQENHRFCRSHPVTGEKVCGSFSASEGQQQDAGVAWNLAGAQMWEAWVDLNSAVQAQQDAETALNDLLRLRNDPQEADIKVAQAEAAYQTALAELAVAEAQVASLKAVPRAEQVNIASAQVKQAEADLTALQVERDKHTLKAPLAGWVVERVAHEGEMAAPGVSLLTLADLTQVTLTVYVPEPDIDTVSIGQRVNVFVDAFPGEPFSGQIITISDEAEFTPKNVQTKEERVNTVFAVKIKLDNQDQRLKPGMPADAVLSAGPRL